MGLFTDGFKLLKKADVYKRQDGLSEVIFHTEAVPRVNMMIQKLKFGKIATFDDYLKLPTFSSP